MDRPLLGAVFAGGKSLRMGRDKRCIGLNDTPMWKRVAHRLEPLCHEVVVLYGDRAIADLGAFRGVADLQPRLGPIGGLETALSVAEDRDVLALACDLPGVDEELLVELVALSRSGQAQVVAASAQGQTQPLCAVYRSGTLEVVRKQIGRGERALRALLLELSVDILEVSPQALANLNSPEDLAAWHGRAESSRVSR